MDNSRPVAVPLVLFHNQMQDTFLILSLAVLVSLSSQKEIVIKNEKCRTCNFLVACFDEGLRKTARQHFAGGDTAWEEKNLGKYAVSETRLIEVMEGVCKKSTLPNVDTFTGISELEFKCASQMENHEELIEQYYYEHQAANMSTWLCITNLKLCCPDQHFGKDCEKCPGVQEGAPACFGRGSCHGDGSREGTGKCKCEEGYIGNQCRHCDSDFFETEKTPTSILCKKCYEGCTGGCTGEGPKGCSRCRNGWTLHEAHGCVDVNECESGEACSKDNERCENSIGSFSCVCEKGFKRDEVENCVLDIEAPPRRPWLPPDLLLKVVSMTSLVGIITLVVWRGSTFLSMLCAVAVVAVVLIELYVNPGTIPDEAKRILGH
ncbi:unnamed protein product [Caenorhabditis auriculariae]|uniref:EGF-like domain-containing protein n=1 Tax=Caenorhabditis auriculariae TaxID=2777116 RepID=A0A8S1HJK1_9PELO|nr:unnamed protein product [Caenorhabditis auriculariae]